MEDAFKNVFKNQPHAINPIYTTKRPDQPVILYRGNLEFHQNNHIIPGEGTIALIWQTSPKIIFQLYNTSLLPILGESQAELYIPKTKIRLNILKSGRNFLHTKTEPDISGLINSQVVVTKHKPLKCLQFHLTNFHDIFGGMISQENKQGKSVWAGRVILEDSCWKITIDSVRNYKSLYDELNTSGGFAITHTGLLERIDNVHFSVEQSNNILSGLRLFLSFSRGFWISPILPVGLDDSNHPIYKEWSNWRINTWRGVYTWFDDLHSDMLQKVLPGFFNIWNSTNWKDPIELAISWYIESNVQSGGLEASIVATQTALELLSWVMFVENSKITQEFDKLPASDKLRLLLLKMNISYEEFPTEFADLKNYAKTNNWIDGPHAFTEFRNGITHPKKQKRERSYDAPFEVKWEIWRLGLWYLELILLRLFGYKGSYSNRLINNRWRGDVEPVPWAD